MKSSSARRDDGFHHILDLTKGMNMNTPEQPINPPEYKQQYTAQELEDAREDAYQKLLADGLVLVNLEYEEFNLAETNNLFNLLAAIMTDRRDNQQDHIDKMEELFKSKLCDRATAMALQYLSEPRD
jgi:hypothetical protein